MLKTKYWLYLMIILGIIFRFSGVFKPLVDVWPGGDPVYMLEVDYCKKDFWSCWRIYGEESPGTTWSIYLLSQVLGINSFSARILQIITGSLTIFVIYKIGEEIYDKNAALLAAALYSVSYPIAHYSQAIQPDTQAIFFGFLAVYLSLKKKKFIYILLSCLTAVFFKQTMVFVPAALFVYGLIKKRDFTTKAFFLCFASLVLVATISLAQYTGECRDSDIINKGGFFCRMDNPGILLNPLFYYRSILRLFWFFPLCPFGAMILVKNRGNILFYLFLLSLAVLIVGAEGTFNHDYYLLILMPILSINGSHSILAKKYLSPRQKKWLVVFSLTMLCFCICNSVLETYGINEAFISFINHKVNEFSYDSRSEDDFDFEDIWGKYLHTKSEDLKIEDKRILYEEFKEKINMHIFYHYINLYGSIGDFMKEIKKGNETILTMQEVCYLTGGDVDTCYWLMDSIHVKKFIGKELNPDFVIMSDQWGSENKVFENNYNEIKNRVDLEYELIIRIAGRGNYAEIYKIKK